MTASGKKSDLDFKVSTDAEKAISDLTRIIAKQDGVIKKTKEQNTQFKKNQREMQKSIKDLEKGTSTRKKGLEKTKQEMTGIGSISKSTVGSVKNWVQGFVGLAAISSFLNKIVASMKEASDFQKEMLGTALGFEQISMKIAQLRKQTDQAGQRTAQKDILAVARAADVLPDVAAEALFFSESSFEPGSAAAKSSAEAIASFAAPAGLTPEEVKGIPKIFSAFGAETRPQQDVILNQLVAATGGSSAETGEFINPLVSLTNVFKAMGFTFEETLAKMVAQIEVSGSVSKAAEDTRRFAEIASGRRTEKAMEFLISEGKKQDVDFQKLSVPERLEFFTDKVFDEFEKAGKLDELSKVLGGESFKVVQLGASETARRKFETILPKISEAKTSTFVQDLSEEFSRTMTARDVQFQISNLASSSKRGGETEASARLELMIDAIFKLSTTLREDFGAKLFSALTPESVEKKNIGLLLLEENLLLAKERGGTDQEISKIDALLERLPSVLSLRANKELVSQIFDVSEGFQLPGKLQRTAVDPDRFISTLESPQPGSLIEANKRYFESIGRFFDIPNVAGPGSQISPSGVAPGVGSIGDLALDQSVIDQTAAINANTEAIKDQTDALRRKESDFSSPTGGGD